MSSQALEAVDRILNLGGDSDDVLRAVVSELAGDTAIQWAGVRFAEQGAFVLGPEAGEPAAERRVTVPIVFQGEAIGELAVDGEADLAVLERIALLISAHVLVGWDTGGESWEP